MMAVTITLPKVLRTISGYAVEWDFYYPNGRYGDDFKNVFCFKQGAFDAAIASRADIKLTQDLDGKTVFARTGDGTLRIESDETGLLVTADLLDSPHNRILDRKIDTGRIRGWSHLYKMRQGGHKFRHQIETGVFHCDNYAADLLELTLVVNKVPRQKIRKTPIFLTGGPRGAKV